MTRFTGPTLKVLDKPCAECPFTGAIELEPGRLAEIVRTCHTQANERPFVCHKTAYGEGVAPVVCRGFHDRYPECSSIQQVAARLGLLEVVTIEQAMDPAANPKRPPRAHG